VGLHIHVGVGLLAEVDLGAGDAEAGHCALHGHVTQIERGQAFGRESVYGIHGDAVAVGVDKLVVDPVAAAVGQLVNVQFAHGQHHLAQRSVDLVAINVDVGKVVVSANL